MTTERWEYLYEGTEEVQAEGKYFPELMVQRCLKFIDENRGWGMFKKGSVTASLDRLHINYHEFRDLTSGAPVGEEPLYSLDANVIQFFVSFWY